MVAVFKCSERERECVHELDVPKMAWLQISTTSVKLHPKDVASCLAILRICPLGNKVAVSFGIFVAPLRNAPVLYGLRQFVAFCLNRECRNKKMSGSAASVQSANKCCLLNQRTIFTRWRTCHRATLDKQQLKGFEQFVVFRCLVLVMAWHQAFFFFIKGELCRFFRPTKLNTFWNTLFLTCDLLSLNSKWPPRKWQMRAMPTPTFKFSRTLPRRTLCNLRIELAV